MHPTLDSGAIEKEIVALHSEFVSKAMQDDIRFEQLMGTMARPGHPFTRFSWGCEETLRPVAGKSRKLAEFIAFNYRAQYMTLSIYSSGSLETIQEQVLNIFKDFPSSEDQEPKFPSLKDPFDVTDFHKIYKVVSVEARQKVQLTWQLPSQEEHWRTKPLKYLARLMENEGSGSIISYLRKRQMATSVDCGKFAMNEAFGSSCSFFQISLEVTDAGFMHMDHVVRSVFEYMKSVNNSDGHHQFWKELRAVERLRGEHLDKRTPIEIAERTAKAMHRCPIDECVVGDTFVEFDINVIKSSLKELSAERVNVGLWSKGFTGKTDRKEKYFQTCYQVHDIDEAWIRGWIECIPSPEFHMPPPNNYIPSVFTMVDQDTAEDHLKPPLVETDVSRLFFKKDRKYKVPEAGIYFLLRSGEPQRTPSSACLHDLHGALLRNAVSNWLR